MDKTTKMEIKDSEGRTLDANGTCKLTLKVDPLAFPMNADWMQYYPKTPEQRKLKKLFLDARTKGRLHDFTCMAIDPSLDPVSGKVVYYPGLPPAVGHSNRWWMDMFKKYAPNRNSRQMTKTEYACKCLFLIQKLVEEKHWKIEHAWFAVCDDSRELGHYCNSDNPKSTLEPTGSREICGFYDLGNAYKMLAEDPWEEPGGFLIAGADFCNVSYGRPLSAQGVGIGMDGVFDNALGQLALD